MNLSIHEFERFIISKLCVIFFLCQICKQINRPMLKAHIYTGRFLFDKKTLI
jgi:hypothetical protein